MKHLLIIWLRSAHREREWLDCICPLPQYDYEYDEHGERVILGKGTFGVVYAGRDLSNQVRLAIKEIPERDSRWGSQEPHGRSPSPAVLVPCSWMGSDELGLSRELWLIWIFVFWNLMAGDFVPNTVVEKSHCIGQVQVILVQHLPTLDLHCWGQFRTGLTDFLWNTFRVQEVQESKFLLAFFF